MDNKIALANATIVLNSVAVTTIYVDAGGCLESTLLRIAGLSCLSDLKSLAESGLYMGLHAHAPLGEDWEWRRPLTKSETGRQKKWLAAQYGR